MLSIDAFKPTDYLAGIMLLGLKSSEKENDLKDFSELNKIPNWMNPKTAASYFKYSLAMYSWPAHFFIEKRKTIKSLCFSSLLFKSNGKNLDYPFEGGRKGHINFEAFKLISNIEEKDVIYASFKDDLFLLPFCIFFDHQLKSVVIAIRGSLSMEYLNIEKKIYFK